MKKIHIIGYIAVAVAAYNIGLSVQQKRVENSLGDVMPELHAVMKAGAIIDKNIEEGKYENEDFAKMHEDFEFEIIAEMESEK